MKKDFEESGFFDDPEAKAWVAEFKRPCMAPNHNPPGLMVIPQGQYYKHVCPSCGSVSIVRPSMVTY